MWRLVLLICAWSLAAWYPSLTPPSVYTEEEDARTEQPYRYTAAAGLRNGIGDSEMGQEHLEAQQGPVLTTSSGELSKVGTEVSRSA